MFHPARLLLAPLILSVSLHGQRSLEHAWLARSMLGPDIWSQVISIRNDNRSGSYPRTVHALVFELAGILWFYTDVDGTQSFSLHVGRVEAEKRNFAPLLRDIDPGFRSWTVIADQNLELIGGRELPNGCFIESVIALRERVARGERTENPRLLSLYMETGRQRKGHTVLAYETNGVLEIFDPSHPRRSFVFSKHGGRDPLILARAFAGPDVVKARFVPLGAPPDIESVASVGGGRDRVSAVVIEEAGASN